MDADTIRAVHRYGAVFSALLVGGGIAAFLLKGPDSNLGVLLGLFGPLFGFYFIGAELQYRQKDPVLGEELLRGVVWYFGSLLGWAYITTGSDAIPVTGVIGVGLPAVTAVAIVLGFVAVRRVTGLDLKVSTDSGQLLVSITGSLVGGFLVLYLVLVEQRSWLLVPVYVAATVVGMGYWWRYAFDSRPQPG